MTDATTIAETRPRKPGAKPAKNTRSAQQPGPKSKLAQSKKSQAPKSDAEKRALWPAASVEFIPVAELIGYAQNARYHSKSQLKQIADLMETFGWTNAVLRDEQNVIWAGNGRIQAAPLLIGRGRTEFDTAPVITARGWTEAQKKAYALADNQVSLNAGWDAKLLEAELKEISGMGFQMELLGFTASDLRRHLGHGNVGLTDADAELEPPADAVSRLGDLWLLGPHRVICGDSTSKTTVSRLFDGARAVLMDTDPPYGVNYDASWRGRAKSADGKRVSIGVHAEGKVSNDNRFDWREAFALFPGDVAYVWHAGKFAAGVQTSLEAAGFEIRSQIIWRKNNMVIGRGDYHWQHEPCWYAVRKGGTAHWVGGRKETTVWDIAKPMKSESGHSTQKPVECMRRPIENNTREGDIVYDPFLGSGTTLIAAEQALRVCYGCELDPGYVDVIIRRWQEFTGKKALLSGRQLSFEEMDAERKHGQKRSKAPADKRAPPPRKSKRKAAEPARAEAKA